MKSASRVATALSVSLLSMGLGLQSASAVEISTPGAETRVDLFGFIAVAPGVYSGDQAPANNSGDADPSVEVSSEYRLNLGVGSADGDLTINAGLWSRDDARIFPGQDNGELRMIWLDWNPNDLITVHAGRSGNFGNTWNHRTLIWETYIGWTPVLPTGGYFLMWENNDLIDVQFHVTPDLDIGLNLREGGGISSLGAGSNPNNIGGDVQGPCSTATTVCQQSYTFGPTFVWRFTENQRLAGHAAVEEQDVERAPGTGGFNNSQSLSHSAVFLAYHNDYDEYGSKFGVQYTLLDVEGFTSASDLEVNDFAATWQHWINGKYGVYGDLNLVNHSPNVGQDRDDTYIGVGVNMKRDQPGQQIGISYKMLDVDMPGTVNDFTHDVVEVHFFQSF